MKVINKIDNRIVLNRITLTELIVNFGNIIWGQVMTTELSARFGTSAFENEFRTHSYDDPQLYGGPYMNHSRNPHYSNTHDLFPGDEGVQQYYLTLRHDRSTDTYAVLIEQFDSKGCLVHIAPWTPHGRLDEKTGEWKNPVGGKHSMNLSFERATKRFKRAWGHDRHWSVWLFLGSKNTGLREASAILVECDFKQPSYILPSSLSYNDPARIQQLRNPVRIGATREQMEYARAHGLLDPPDFPQAPRSDQPGRPTVSSGGGGCVRPLSSQNSYNWRVWGGNKVPRI